MRRSTEHLLPVARELRKSQTSAEVQLWRALQRRCVERFRFRRQVPMHGVIVDFACLEASLAIEVDGATHSTDAEVAHDARRDELLKMHGIATLRFGNVEIYENLQGVLETIRLKLLELRPEGPRWTSRMEKPEEREFFPNKVR